jgi:hypothetical protein
MTKLYNPAEPPLNPTQRQSYYPRTEGGATYIQQIGRKTSQQTINQVNAEADLRRHQAAYRALTQAQKDSWFSLGMGRSYQIEWPVYFWYTGPRAYASCATARELLGLAPVPELTNTNYLYEPSYISFTPHALSVEVDWYLTRYSAFTADIGLQRLPSPGTVTDWTQRRRLALLAPTGDPQTIGGIPPGTYAFWLRCIHTEDGDSPWRYDGYEIPDAGYSLPYVITIPGGV